MQSFAPRYYKEFKCISTRCSHSCCIGWEICVDGESVERYRRFRDDGDASIYDSINFDGEEAHFALCENGRCPHLCDTGLCNIILNHGEEALSEICARHPRFYNISPCRAEIGLGAVCEEAARLILECRDYCTLEESTERLSFDDSSDTAEGIDAYSERARIYTVLSNTDIPYHDRLKMLWERYSSAPSSLSDEYWRELLLSLEYMDEGAKEDFIHYSSSIESSSEYDEACERFLAYLIYRYVFGKMTDEEIKCALGFSFFCERLFFSILNHTEKSSVSAITAARTVSEEMEYSESNRDEIMSEFAFL